MSTDLAIRSNHGAPLVRRTLNGPTMGTRYSAVFFAPEWTDTDALAAALSAAVNRVDRQMSTWKAKSDLNRLNRAPEGRLGTDPARTDHRIVGFAQNRTSLEGLV
jgi:FAD:protein FMN transferase